MRPNKQKGFYKREESAIRYLLLCHAVWDLTLIKGGLRGFKQTQTLVSALLRPP